MSFPWYHGYYFVSHPVFKKELTFDFLLDRSHGSQTKAEFCQIKHV